MCHAVRHFRCSGAEIILSSCLVRYTYIKLISKYVAISTKMVIHAAKGMHREESWKYGIHINVMFSDTMVV